MIDHTRTFYENIKDAFYFAVSDKVSIVIIGIILTIAGTLEEYHTNDPLLSIISIIVLLCFLLFEAGYSSKIIVEILEGSTKTPAIENIPEMLTHGLKEFIVTLGYSIVSYILGMVVEGIYVIYHDSIILLPSLLIFALILFVMNSSLIYMGHKSGKIKDGFNIKGIFGLYGKLGFLGTLFLFITCIISQLILFSSVFNVFSWDIWIIIKFIMNFLLAPISLIFSLRLFALQGRLN